MQKGFSWAVILCVICSVLALDVWTKSLAVDAFPLPGVSPIGEISKPYIVFENVCGIDFSLTQASNAGAAWGIFEDFPDALVVLRIFLITCLIVYLMKYNTHSHWRLPFALIISGAIGNVIDYFVYGYVVDMFLFSFFGYNYPVFNVADSAIFIGALWMVWNALFDKEFHGKNTT